MKFKKSFNINPPSLKKYSMSKQGILNLNLNKSFVNCMNLCYELHKINVLLI